MTEDQVRHLKIHLQEQLASLQSETPALAISHCADENEFASLVADAYTRVAVNERSARRMQEIEEALRMMDGMEYGYCRECGGEIGWARLQARPTAIFCVDCQEERERSAA